MNTDSQPSTGKLDISDELIAERMGGRPGQTPPDMERWMRPIVATIDVINLWVGRFACLLLIPLIVAMVIEVVSRSAFGAMAYYGADDTARALGLGPTLWVYEVTRMVAGALFMLGAGYALMRGVHIRADFLYRTWTPRAQATSDALLYLAFYFPAMVFFLWIAIEYTWDAWATGERAMDTTMMAPLAPARTAMPAGVFFLLLQGVSEFLKCLYKMGSDRARPFTWALPVYIAGLAVVTLAVFAKDLMPIGQYWSDLVATTGLADIPRHWIGLIMLAVMLFSIFMGFPISFTLIFLGFAFGAWAGGTRLVFLLETLKFNETMLDDQLVAVPLFVFMGILMEQAGLMQRLFTSIHQIFYRTPGALFVAVLIVSTIFAAATGIVGASVTILGIMAAATMTREGYNVRLGAGAITAGGTLGILIPPSVMLLVMGPILEIPVNVLFAAAIVPGLMLAGLYIAYTLIRCALDPSLGPLPPKVDWPETSPYFAAERWAVLGALVVLCWFIALAVGSWAGGIGMVAPLVWLGAMIAVFKWSRRARPGGFYFSDLWREFMAGLVPPAALIAATLGSILLGFATPAEGAGCGAAGAFLLVLAYRQLTWKRFGEALIKTLEITVLIMFLVAASNFFGAVFSWLKTPVVLTEWLLTMELAPAVILIVIMALIFLLGWPLEWVPIVVIIMPLMVPVLVALEFGLPERHVLTWFGILVAVNLQTAWLSPPVALSAYFLKGVAPSWDLKDIYIGMLQFMVIQLLGLVLIFVFPEIALWLPEYIYGDNW